VQGLSRTTARIFVIDRELKSWRTEAQATCPPICRLRNRRSPGLLAERETLHPLYAMVSKPVRFRRRAGRTRRAAGEEVDGALSGSLTVDRRPTPDGKAVVVSPRIRSGSEIRSKARSSSRRRPTQCSPSAIARSSDFFHRPRRTPDRFAGADALRVTGSPRASPLTRRGRGRHRRAGPIRGVLTDRAPVMK
jgi:hypothetical protein